MVLRLIAPHTVKPGGLLDLCICIYIYIYMCLFGVHTSATMYIASYYTRVADYRYHENMLVKMSATKSNNIMNTIDEYEITHHCVFDYII